MQAAAMTDGNPHDQIASLEADIEQLAHLHHLDWALRETERMQSIIAVSISLGLSITKLKYCTDGIKTCKQ